jgi:hypothetical protein
MLRSTNVADYDEKQLHFLLGMNNVKDEKGLEFDILEN